MLSSDRLQTAQGHLCWLQTQTHLMQKARFGRHTWLLVSTNLLQTFIFEALEWQKPVREQSFDFYEGITFDFPLPPCLFLTFPEKGMLLGFCGDAYIHKWKIYFISHTNTNKTWFQYNFNPPLLLRNQTDTPKVIHTVEYYDC